MSSEPLGMWLYQGFGVPWKKDDIHERLKTITRMDEIGALYGGVLSSLAAVFLAGTTAPMSFAEAADFGPYHMLLPDTKRAQARLSDEELYALALYLYSLQPPPNPNVVDEKAKAGQEIFAREGCPMCRTPPLYTSNKLTLAPGFCPAEGRAGEK